MLKAFKYRLYPTKAQATSLHRCLDECRWVYNHFLEDRKVSYEETGKSPSFYDQCKSLPMLKRDRPSLDVVYAQVLQEVARRIDRAFDDFFRRCKQGENPGYPRFRGYGRYDSFCYPQKGFALNQQTLYLSKIGNVRIVLHRPVEGRIKTCCVKRTSTGKWYVTFSCKVEQKALSPNDDAVGIDVGLTSFATFSTGEKIENPRFFRTDEKSLAQVQRRMGKHAKGTPERRKKRRAVARVHERIRFRRHNFTHQESRKIVDRFGLIAVEDLAVKQMMSNHCLAKSIQDASWTQFVGHMTSKAAYAGRQVVAVKPAYTSQDCSRCHHRQKLALAERIYRCPCCGLEIDRDQNAALNILTLGQQSLVST